MQLATINPDGTPHLVTMFYALRDGRIAFWTYRASQKARNLARDPRVTCLVEDGDEYFELRGVQVAGVVAPIEDLAGVAEIGRLDRGAAAPACPPTRWTTTWRSRAQARRLPGRAAPGQLSWDHRKLLASR